MGCFIEPAYVAHQLIIGNAHDAVADGGRFDNVEVRKTLNEMLYLLVDLIERYALCQNLILVLLGELHGKKGNEIVGNGRQIGDFGNATQMKLS